MTNKQASYLWLFSIVFSFSETAYFGYNFLPQSRAEVICDGIGILTFLVSAYYIAKTSK